MSKLVDPKLLPSHRAYVNAVEAKGNLITIRRKLVSAAEDVRKLTPEWSIDLELMIMDCIEFLDDPKVTEAECPAIIDKFNLSRFLNGIEQKEQEAYIQGFAKAVLMMAVGGRSIEGVFRMPQESGHLFDRLYAGMLEVCNGKGKEVSHE